jgi:hypothetical protein
MFPARRAYPRGARSALWGVAAFGMALFLAAPTPAAARLKTYTLRAGPVAMGAFNVTFPRAIVRSPRVDGYVVRMQARLVDGRGRRVTIRDVMLHHVVFYRLWRSALRNDCASPTAEPFYGTGEETQSLRLPPGYGYRIRPGDRWRC